MERKKMIAAALNSALLTDEEMERGKKPFNGDHPWKKFADPFFGGNLEEMWQLDMPNLRTNENKELDDVMAQLGGLGQK